MRIDVRSLIAFSANYLPDAVDTPQCVDHPHLWSLVWGCGGDLPRQRLPGRRIHVDAAVSIAVGDLRRVAFGAQHHEFMLDTALKRSPLRAISLDVVLQCFQLA